MDNVASSSAAPQADLTASKLPRSASAGPATDAKPKLEELQSARPHVSAAEVAAEAAEGKVKSINTLASVAESIEEAVEVLNEALSRKHTSAQIRRDDQLNRFLVTIKDKESGEVVREVPPEALLKFARNLEELKGILFDETL